MLCIAMSFMAQETKKTFTVVDGDTIQLKGAHPWRNSENRHGIIRDFSHLSISPMIGFNIFDGDFNKEMKHAIYGPSIGLMAEYNFTPVWSAGVEYMWSRYHVTGKNNSSTAKTLLDGNMHKLGVDLSMDAISLFFPHWNRKLFNGFASLGAGYMWYKNSVMFDDYSRGKTATSAPIKMDSYKGTFYLQMGVAFEINLNRTFAIGARATYAYFMNDYTDGRGYSTEAALASKNNDGMFDIVAYMRVKFNAIKRTHTRNIYSLDSWKLDGVAGPAQVAHDTVIIHRHDSIIVREVVTQEVMREIEYDNTQYYYAYFANASSELNDRALVTIQQVADRLNDDEEYYAIIIGYCDNTGTEDINFVLGDKRAESVISELHDVYDININRMYGIGMGKIAGKGRSSAAYGPNRRAVIRLVNKTTFNRMRDELEETKTMRATSALPKETESGDLQTRQNKKVAATRSTTLNKLARTEYGNPNCWVYLYIANKDKLESPDMVNEGMELVVPELTEKEKKITKEECLILYGMIRSKQ
jgi:outer membrane protein OmpA-like peptidoglycan-associated protein